MEINELLDLRSGLKMFASTVNEVARRANVSPTYVKVTLSGNVKNWKDNPTCLRIIEKAKELYEERCAANEEIRARLSLAC